MAGIFSLAGLAERSAGEALAFGLGVALGRSLEPIGVTLAQEAWKVDPIRAPDAGTLADGVAQGQVDPGKAAEWATEHGYGSEAFAALVNIANTGPALGYAFSAWRRGELTDAEFNTALRRTGLEPEWDTAMRALKEERLDLGAIATAIHRGIMRGQGLIIQEPPTGAGNVPQIPQSSIDPVHEAAAHGVDAERLRVLVANTGLPPGLMEMLRLLNMGKVTTDDVKRAVAESNLRNEYMDVAIELRRQLLTPTEYIDAHLRGWISEPEMLAGAALHGMTREDALQLFKTHGRPIPERQVLTGEARGGTYDGDTSGIPVPFLKALQQGSLRPEWYNLAYHNRYTYPSAFVLRGLASSGAIDHATTEKTLLEIGWEPGFASKVADAWHGGGTATTDKHVTKAETSLFTATHSSYVAMESDQAAARTALDVLNVAADVQAQLFTLWDAERHLIRAQLTPAQVKKAVGAGLFTEAQAIAALLDRGYSQADAETFLRE